MTKKKIAILTQPLGHNYGGIIQNYALQKVLKDLGHEPLTINRISGKELDLLTAIKVELIYKIKNIKGLPYTNRVKKKVFRNNLNFIEKNLHISEQIYSTESLKDYVSKKNFDTIIVGSDQTWRPKYSPNIYNYYLDFLKDNNQIKKLAYASSFGTAEWEYTEEQTKIVKQLAKQFHAISVREAAGVDLCREKLGVEAVHLLDPTLLLTAEDYSELINQPKTNKELYTYVLDETSEKINFIERCSNKLKMKSSSKKSKYDFYSTKSSNIKDFIIPPLEEWLQGFRDAEFVITDSFHGTVFSIINKKPFISIVNKERGASRFESILSKLGLEDRMVYDVNAFDPSLLHKNIDYETVHQKLNALKEESLNFLKENL